MDTRKKSSATAPARRKTPASPPETPAGPAETPARAAAPGHSDRSDNDADVTPEERALLARSERNPPDEDDRAIHEASLDETDDDGTPLEEKGLDRDLSGDDLDIPGADQDDADEAIGEEDEENNEYSLGGDNHDD